MQKRNEEGLYRSPVFLEAFLEFSSTQHCACGTLEDQRKTDSGPRDGEVGGISRTGLSHSRQQGERWVEGAQVGLPWSGERHSWGEKDNQARKGFGADYRARRTELVSWGSGSQSSF